MTTVCRGGLTLSFSDGSPVTAEQQFQIAAPERYLPEFMAFFFPAAHATIDWSKGYAFLDKELQAVVQDAELGRRFVDALARVTRIGSGEAWILAHIEVQGKQETSLPNGCWSTTTGFRCAQVGR
ncbi:MAG: hypothetical protein WCF85_18065 [Rhodospirillaceae bacterium]